jgi:hypothetical protein
MTKKATTTKTENPKLTKILDEVHEDKKYRGFCDRLAEHFSVENMGHDPSESSFQDFFCEAEAAACMEDEKRGWMKVARAIMAELKKKGMPLTIRNGIAAFEASPKKYQKLYA